MNQLHENLAHSYICPKCRGKKPHIREVVIEKGRTISILGLRLPCPSFSARDNQYLEVTCSLCGYTEFYNLALYAQATEQTLEKHELPLPERPNGA